MNDSNSINENLNVVAGILMRCFVIGLLVLLIWYGFLLFADDLTYKVHSWTVPISRQQFNTINYAGMMMTKAFIFLFFLLPYTAIKLVPRNRR